MGRPSVNLLLDTHIWLWSLLEPERLAPPVAAALASGQRQATFMLKAREAGLVVSMGDDLGVPLASAAGPGAAPDGPQRLTPPPISNKEGAGP